MFRKLASETGIYGVSTVLGRLIGYMLVPIHTGVLETENYGLVSEFYSYAAFLAVLYLYGMETTFFRFAAKGNNNVQAIFNAAVSSLIVSSIILSSILILFSTPIATLLQYPNSGTYVLLFAILIGTDSITAIPFAMLRIQQKAFQFATLKIINIVFNVLLNIFFFIICPKIYSEQWLPFLRPLLLELYDPSIGLGYAFLANVISSGLNLLLLYPVFRNFRFNLNFTLLKPLYIYTYPLIFSGLAAAINQVLDKPLIKWLLPEDFYPGLNSLEAVGIYGACYKLPIFVTLVVQAFKFAAEPFFFSQAKRKDSPQIFAKLMKYFIIFSLLMIVALQVNLEWISQILIRNEAYRKGIGVVPILLFANVFLGIYYNLSVWFKISDKTEYAATIGGIGALITLLGNLFLIPVAGYYGSAISVLLCYAGMTFISYWLGQKYYPVPYKILNALLYFFLTLSILILSAYIKQTDFWKNLLIQNTLLLAFVLCIWLIEIKDMQKIIRFKVP